VFASILHVLALKEPPRPTHPIRASGDRSARPMTDIDQLPTAGIGLEKSYGQKAALSDAAVREN
jgi:hypothetical protein